MPSSPLRAVGTYQDCPSWLERLSGRYVESLFEMGEIEVCFGRLPCLSIIVVGL